MTGGIILMKYYTKQQEDDMNINEAKNLKVGQLVYHRTKRNSDGSPMKAKVTSVKTWKRSPERIEVGLKRGLYDYAKFNESDIHLLSIREDFLRESDFDRVNSDMNGNPRYVIHFLRVLPGSIKNNDAMSIDAKYQFACKLMNKIGGRKYHNKQYGGGIVFQCYSIPDLIKSIDELINNI